jgi:valine--pyruvate aminotransferase
VDFSSFGKKFTADTGIQCLMDDIGNAVDSGHDMIMMGGGNPANIPAIEAILHQRLQQLTVMPNTLRQLIGQYDPPQGNKDFIEDLAMLLRQRMGWPVKRHNIALTNGSQAGFFMLFNLFAGNFDDGTQRYIQLPMAPEYIGYADTGLRQDFFTAARPQIDELDDHLFKYRIAFDDFKVNKQTGAICVSRPTNPTGNVITDVEIEQLDALAQRHRVPLIIDGAYGVPFPGIIFTEATPFWNDNTIVCLSLSKFGLPGARTGIIIASEAIIRAVSSINAIINLASGSMGAMLVGELVQNGDIINLSQTIVRPYYEDLAQFAVQTFRSAMGKNYPYSIHKPEGTMFLWFWFNNIPISSQVLYERLKQRGVVVVSGHHFFPGITTSWLHQHQCIRVNYAAQSRDRVKRGLDIIADEVKQAYIAG